MVKRLKDKSCVFCGIVPNALAPHLLGHIGEKPFHCGICKKEFNHNGMKKRHEKTHSQEKRFSCGICKKRFQRNDNLKQHTTHVHSDERPYPCPRCSYKAKEKWILKRHLNNHNGQKRFQCELCPKRFVTTGDRQQHLLTHTGEKAHKYAVFPKSFASVQSASDHQYLKEKVYICKKCEKEYKYAHSLKCHKKICKGRRTAKKMTTAPAPFCVAVITLLLLNLLS